MCVRLLSFQVEHRPSPLVRILYLPLIVLFDSELLAFRKWHARSLYECASIDRRPNDRKDERCSAGRFLYRRNDKMPDLDQLLLREVDIGLMKNQTDTTSIEAIRELGI